MSDCNHTTLESCLRADECAECLRERAKAHSLHRPGSVASPWLVRMVEGMRRDTYGIFVDGSARPIIKSKNERELERAAEAHNQTLPQNADVSDRRDNPKR
jgi:hypothetical protein